MADHTQADRVVRIGGASGFWGDSSLGAPQLAEMRMRQFLMDEGYTFTMGTLGARPGIRL